MVWSWVSNETGKATESGIHLILQKNDILWVVGDKKENEQIL
jgi:hypothetical protein